jgi:hypothetical protein
MANTVVGMDTLLYVPIHLDWIRGLANAKRVFGGNQI